MGRWCQSKRFLPAQMPYFRLNNKRRAFAKMKTIMKSPYQWTKSQTVTEAKNKYSINLPTNSWAPYEWTKFQTGTWSKEWYSINLLTNTCTGSYSRSSWHTRCNLWLQLLQSHLKDSLLLVATYDRQAVNWGSILVNIPAEQYLL